jgi:sulfatase maturation enzyme AslB (radical SAM superfamily)
MTLETAQKTLDAIFYTPSNNITIEFQWWEPLLNWDIVRFFIEQGRIKAQHLQKNVSFALVSNLTLMDEEKMDYLIENGINISTSLDWDELLHNENRVLKSWNSFKKVTYWIRRFNEEYEKRWLQNSFWEYLKVWALLTVTKNSLSKHKEIIDTYVWLWVNWVFLRMLNPYWFALADMKRLSYSSQDFWEFYRKSLDYILELNKDWTNFREQLSSIYLAKMLNPKDPNYLDERSPCWACIWQLAYNYDWKVYTCDEWRMLWRMWIDDFLVWKLTSDPKGDYGNLMNSEITKTMVQSSTIDGLPWYNDDVYKPYIWICPIYNYKMTWNIFSIYAKDQRRIIENSILDYLFDKIRSKDNNDIFEKWLWNDTSNLNICK